MGDFILSDIDEMDEMKEVIDEFLVESSENLDQLDNDLLSLEEDPDNAEVMGSIFRAIHTIKGTCGFLGFEKLEKVSHTGENLLSKLRDGVLQMNEARADALLKMVDAIRQMLSCIESKGHDGEEVYADLIQTLTELQQDQESPDAAGVEVAGQSAKSEYASPAQAVEIDTDEALETGMKVSPLGESLVKSGYVKPEQVAGAIQKQLEGDHRQIGEILVQNGAIDHGTLNKTINEQMEKREKNARSSHAAGSSIRVDVHLLDQLMNLVGELVLARNHILQYSNVLEDSGLANTSQRLSLVTTDLQEKVMQTRMQPVGSVWSKFPRVVRDLAHGCGKEIHIVMEGKETELDKTLIEAIKDPLTHLVRNSVDHGIEMPEERIARGKPAEGTLLLRAFHEGGLVNIEIIDDGGGIDPESLKKKAIEKEMITAGQAAQMSDKDAWNLIFRAGLSTAKKVTNISGRGVGMDVVKTNIEKIGGIIDIQSKHGEGTTVRIKIPLTLAIIPALTAICAGDRYAIPQVNLLELVMLEGEEIRTGIEMVQGAPVYRLRGDLLPLVYLNQVLWGDDSPMAASGTAVSDKTAHGEIQAADTSVKIAVLQAGGQHFGLIVDDVEDTQEIVVKPLSTQLKGAACLAGSTIMGDGSVALILDVQGIAESANLLSDVVRDQALASEVNQEDMKEENQQTLLLLRNPDDGCMAIPLSEVARLEEFSRTAVERAGEQQVVQYRDQILPLIDVFATLPERRDKERLSKDMGSAADTGVLQVVVYSFGGKNVGLVVDRILDVVELALDVRGQSSRRGVLSTAVINDRVTELLDASEIIRMSDAEIGSGLSLSADHVNEQKVLNDRSEPISAYSEIARVV